MIPCTILLSSNVNVTAITIIIINACPSFITKVPPKFTFVVIITHSLMLRCLPTVSIWKVFSFKSIKGIVYSHHQYHRQDEKGYDNNCERRKESFIVIWSVHHIPFFLLRPFGSYWSSYISSGINILPVPSSNQLFINISTIINIIT